MKHNTLKQKTSNEGIDIFTYPPLQELRQDLEKIGHKKENIDRILKALSRLPRYKKSNL